MLAQSMPCPSKSNRHGPCQFARLPLKSNSLPMNAQSTLGTVGLFGAGGAMGHALAPRLEQLGVPYRTIGRDAGRLRREFPNAEAVAADFLTGEGLAEAAKGVDTVFYLAGAPYTKFELHPIMTKNALASARSAGVKRFVHIAPVYSYGPAQTMPVSDSSPHRPTTRKGRFRLQQEQLLLSENGNDMRALVVHLPDFYGPNADNSLANYFINEAVAGKTATFVGPLSADREFVFVPDAAAPLLQLAVSDEAYGRCWNLGAYSKITGAQFSALVFRTIGRPERRRSASKLLLRVAGLFDPTMRELVEMYYLYSSGFVLDDTDLQKFLGKVDKTPYEDGLRLTLDWIANRPAKS